MHTKIREAGFVYNTNQLQCSGPLFFIPDRLQRLFYKDMSACETEWLSKMTVCLQSATRIVGSWP